MPLSTFSVIPAFAVPSSLSYLRHVKRSNIPLPFALVRKFRQLDSIQRAFSVTAKDFEFTHRYVPLHPRVSNDKGELVVQGNRWSFFLCSFSFASILDLRYRVHFWPPAVPPQANKQLTRSRNIEISHGKITYNSGNILLQYDPDYQTSTVVLDLSYIDAKISCFLCLPEMTVACIKSDDNTQDIMFSFVAPLSETKEIRLSLRLPEKIISRICATNLQADASLVVALDG